LTRSNEQIQVHFYTSATKEAKLLLRMAYFVNRSHI